MRADEDSRARDTVYMAKSLGLTQFIVIIVIAVTLIFAWDFGRRILETVQLMRTLQLADQRLTQVEAANAQLVTLKQDVTSDEWLERQARARLHYTKDGETVFIPVTALSAPAVSVPAAPAVNLPPSERTLWVDLVEALFGPVQR